MRHPTATQNIKHTYSIKNAAGEKQTYELSYVDLCTLNIIQGIIMENDNTRLPSRTQIIKRRTCSEKGTSDSLIYLASIGLITVSTQRSTNGRFTANAYDLTEPARAIIAALPISM